LDTLEAARCSAVGGMTFPNGRLAQFLSAASDLKILLLIFDGFVITGGRIVHGARGGPALSPIPVRPAATLNGHELDLMVATPVEPIAEQLAELGILTLVPASALIGRQHVESLLLALVDAASEFPVPDVPLDFETMIPFDGGLLDPLMDDESVLWLMEELERLGLAHVEHLGPLFGYRHDDQWEEDESSSVTMFGVTKEVSDFYAAMTSQVVASAGFDHGIALSPLRSGNHLPREFWLSGSHDSSYYADFAFLHADLLDLDLDDVPLNEIIEFRKGHPAERRRFLRKIREVLRELDHCDRRARESVLRDYREEAAYLSESLALSARKAFRRRGKDLLLGGAGATVTALGNPLAGAIAALRTALGLGGTADVPEMFTYFYTARRHFGGPRGSSGSR
jgi:hypothetical protein